ncbi:3-phosphoshikimate 1-carboxyvinyltransferase [Paludibacter sp. 221]|uniref:3-phosphoshikimate 1-carboxyvinyltransferase n=1 Tax=Paludibacter sp. 221 TaxID=2302939 RepID=UPI0013D21655|nr:3-phosphoshikimate 1-carboxyvinyltransferase [Paludibacter sp. 221]NDV47123.1 3-phosphoshikimate 1-carboxyvinyltransferase [Paludibacter sp. 221]
MYLPVKDININISLPASKSISNRALILNALSYSPYEVANLSDSDDTKVLYAALDSNSRDFDIGAAGTSMRFLTAFLSKTLGEWTITGSERMKQRPIKILVDALNSLGAKIEYIEKEGFPPLRIYGSALMGGNISLNGGVSSQYISALMMIAPYMQNGLKITLEGTIISKPYIYMTLGMMKDFGVDVDFSGNVIDIKPQVYKPVRFTVESDWSAASYWYEILSITGQGQVFLKGLRQNSYQGDSKVAELFENLGVTTEYQPDGAVLTANGQQASKMEYDFINEPDLAQTFAVTCCLKGIPFIFTGLQSLKIKETDRIAALICELRKLGYVLEESENGGLSWNGERVEAEKIISILTYEDHRMAMAFAPVALTREIEIQHPEVVSKSYPSFWNDFGKIKP